MMVKRIIVNIQQYDKAAYPDKLYTEGAGNCSIVAVYDPLRQTAFMGHFADFNGTYHGNQKEDQARSKAYFEEMIGAIAKNLDLKVCKAVVSGMMLYSMNGSVMFESQALVNKRNNWVRDSRENLVAGLVAAGIPESRVIPMFHPEPNRVTSMELDLDTRMATLSYMDFTNWSRRVERVTAHI